ncbi:MAG: hypothetical protein ACLQVM_00030 [Terriglobia bacterium]
MKNGEPSMAPFEGEARPWQVEDALPSCSTRRPMSRQSDRSDSRRDSRPENDRTRVFLHQFSQILTSLHGTLELALLVESDAQEYRRVIQQSLVQAENLVQLFKSYRDLAAGGAPELANKKEQ